MKTKQSLVALGLVACLMALGSAPSLWSCPGNPRTIAVRFTATDVPTGFFDYGNYPGVLGEDGIIRIRGMVIEDLFTVSVPELGISNLQVQGKMGLNGDLKAVDGSGVSWGTFEGSMGGELVLRGYWYMVREKKSDQLWVSKGDILCVFCAGDFEGVIMKGAETIQTWSKLFETGYYGEAEGVLIIPDSVDVGPHRHCPPIFGHR